jgi:GNAT superfamily N-acetyltransferase
VIRRAVSDADLGAYVSIWGTVWPDDPVSVEFVRERLRRETERVCLLAEIDGSAVATGFVGRASDPETRPVGVAVLSAWRRRGLGDALLARCLAHARDLDAGLAAGTVREDEPESVGFVLRRGFSVVDRVVALSLDLGTAELGGPLSDGIEIVELDDARLAEAYEVFTQGAADIPADGQEHCSPFDEWVGQLRTHPLTLLALDGERVVGFADLELRDERTGKLGNNLTTVRRSHRRRGIAEALKRAQIAWAVEHGYRTIGTVTHDANEPMRRLNEKLGFRPLPALLEVGRRL